jgi:hypothetical protein
MKALVFAGLIVAMPSLAIAGAPPCDADLNNDGVVGAADLAMLLGAWGPCIECETSGDCNDNIPCTVDSCMEGECVNAPATGDCCTANGTPGCGNEECCDCVCFFDGFCCDSNWDASCVAATFEFCDAECGCEEVCPGTGDCCETNETPGCDNQVCCDCVCFFNPSCCQGIWDESCLEAAQANCLFECGC